MALDLNSNFTEVKNCGSCGKNTLLIIHDFGNSPLAGYFPHKGNISNDYSIPMQLLFCNTCFLTQISPNVSDELLFTEYRYVSAIGMKQHFTNFANWFQEFLKIDIKSEILEIGSNDGTLLSALTSLGYMPKGIDPASNITKIAKDQNLNVFEDFFNEAALNKYSLRNKFDIVISCNSFAHISNIAEIAKGIAEVLKHDGLFIVEVQSLPELLKKKAIDFIYHEHKYYYSIESISNLLKQYGLYLIDGIVVDTHGGSYRLIFSKIDKKQSLSIIKLISNESELAVRPEYIREKIYEYKEYIEQLAKHIKSEKAKGKKIICFGASGRGNMLLHELKNFNLFEFVVDESKERIGRQMAFSGLEVIEFSKLSEKDYDDCLVLAWNYFDKILQKWPHSNKQIIRPLPILESLKSN
jgi:SAM-dependent methyltransferase